MIRDFKERGATGAKAWATNVMPMHQRYMTPQQDHADIMVLGDAEAGNRSG